VLKAFAVSNGQLAPPPVSQSQTVFGYPGATPSISANGTNNAIVWVVQVDAYPQGGPAVLHAYDAGDLSRELYNSAQAGARDRLGLAQKFTVPAVANGKVYVGSAYGVSVFGNLPAPTITAQPSSQVVLTGSSITLSVGTDSTLPVTYQWQINGTNIAGATNASLTLQNIGSKQTGNYQVVVTSSAGSITSLPATLHTVSLAICPVLTFQGPIGTAYRIDYVADAGHPTNWVTLTNIVIDSSPYYFIDTQSGSGAKRFYRTIPLPQTNSNAKVF
jgi:hypothetical protein